MSRRRIAAIALIALSVAMAVVCWVFLPETVALQLTDRGMSNTVPKFVAVLIPLLLGAVPAVVFGRSASRRALSMSLIGLAVSVVTVVVNVVF